MAEFNAVHHARELRGMGYDAFATADGRVTVNLTVEQAIFFQIAHTVANTREARAAKKPR